MASTRLTRRSLVDVFCKLSLSHRERALGYGTLALMHGLPAAPEMPATDMKGLSFVLLTHGHGDHLDLDLLRQQREDQIHWVIPAPHLQQIRMERNLPAD